MRASSLNATLRYSASRPRGVAHARRIGLHTQNLLGIGRGQPRQIGDIPRTPRPTGVLRQKVMQLPGPPPTPAEPWPATLRSPAASPAAPARHYEWRTHAPPPRSHTTAHRPANEDHLKRLDVSAPRERERGTAASTLGIFGIFGGDVDSDDFSPAREQTCPPRNPPSSPRPSVSSHPVAGPVPPTACTPPSFAPPSTPVPRREAAAAP